MRYFLLTISILAFSCADLSAQSNKDTIFFNNGTVVIGKLLKIKQGVVTFDPDEANDITVKLPKVKTFDASRKIYRVENTHHQVAYGFLKPDSIPQYVRVVFGANEERVFVEEISNLYPFSERIWQRFTGNVSAGYNYTKSSDFGRLNFDMSLSYNTKKHEAGLAASGVYSQTDTGFTRDKEDLNIKDNFYFSPTSFATGFYVYQRNLELGLNHRYQEGLGIGNKFLTNKMMYGWGRTGLVFNQEKSTEGQSSGLLTEFFIQLQFSLFKFTKPQVNFNISQTIYGGITEKGRLRTDGDADLTWEIVKNFKLNLQFYNNYDSKPPTATSSKYDYGTVLGFTYFFL